MPQTQVEERGSKSWRLSSAHAVGRSRTHTSAQRKMQSATDARGKAITARSAGRKTSMNQALRQRSSTPQAHPRQRWLGMQTLWLESEASSLQAGYGGGSYSSLTGNLPETTGCSTTHHPQENPLWSFMETPSCPGSMSD